MYMFTLINLRKWLEIFMRFRRVTTYCWKYDNLGKVRQFWRCSELLSEPKFQDWSKILTVTIPNDTTPHHSVWQCTAKDLQTAFITGDESNLTISVNSLWFKTPKLIPLMWIGLSTSAEQLIKNFTQKKFYVTIECASKFHWGSLETFLRITVY